MRAMISPYSQIGHLLGDLARHAFPLFQQFIRVRIVESNLLDCLPRVPSDHAHDLPPAGFGCFLNLFKRAAKVLPQRVQVRASGRLNVRAPEPVDDPILLMLTVARLRFLVVADQRFSDALDAKKVVLALVGLEDGDCPVEPHGRRRFAHQQRLLLGGFRK